MANSDLHAHPPEDFGYGFHHRPPKTSARRVLVLAIWLNVFMMIAEVIGGIWTNSLALLSDAGHMLTHIFALVVSFVAIQLSERGITRGKTFGWYRAEPIAALVNGITILVIVAIILVEAVKKFIWPEPIQAREMFVVAVAGLIVNLIGAWLLKDHVHDDINIKGSFVHLLTDLFSSIAIVAGGAVIIWTGLSIIDPILSLVICLVISVWAIRLLNESTNVLMEAAPSSIDVHAVTAAIAELPQVGAVHDVHLWEVSSGLYAFTCHVLVDDISVSDTEPLRDRINQLLHGDFHIGHTNLQFEVHPDPSVHHDR